MSAVRLWRFTNARSSITGPVNYRKLSLPDFMTIGNMKVLRLSALRTGHLYPPANIPGNHFCYRTNLHTSHSAAGRTMSMKNSKYTIRNRIRDLPPCSVVQNQPLCNPISYTPIVKNVCVTKDMSMKRKYKFCNQYSRAFSVSPLAFERAEVTNRKRFNNCANVLWILL